MNTQQWFKLLSENVDKHEIIDKIMELHPGYGTEVGWSTYVGGMTDTGHWKVEVLLNVPKYTLERQYTLWKEQTQTMAATAEDWAEQMLKEQESLRDFNREFVNRLIWGK